MRSKISPCVLLLTLILSCSAFAEETISLDSPLYQQVFQRNDQQQAQIVISGTVPEDTETIEVKVDLTPDATKGEAIDWTIIARKQNIYSGNFKSCIKVDAGGWYSITVRAKKIQKTIAEGKVERVGVGDVFLTAGQSNSANCGEDKAEDAKDNRVVYFNGKDFVPAKGPIPGAAGEMGVVWPFLGDMLVKTTQVPTCFRATTLAATQVKEWLPDNEPIGYPLYSTLIERAKWFGPNGIRAVLWHQGESDAIAKTSPEDYCKRLGFVINSMRKEIGYNLDWFVAGASLHGGAAKQAQQDVLQGQKLLWERKIAFQGPYTDDIAGIKYRNGGVHFNSYGMSAHAGRWFVILAAKYKFANPFTVPELSEAKAKTE